MKNGHMRLLKIGKFSVWFYTDFSVYYSEPSPNFYPVAHGLSVGWFYFELYI